MKPVYMHNEGYKTITSSTLDKGTSKGVCLIKVSRADLEAFLQANPEGDCVTFGGRLKSSDTNQNIKQVDVWLGQASVSVSDSYKK